MIAGLLVSVASAQEVLNLAWRDSGEANGRHFGSSLSSAGDVNGDGFGDVIVGAPEPSEFAWGVTSAAFVYFGSAKGLRPARGWSFALPAPEERTGLGSAVAGAGDVNADGFDDVVVTTAPSLGGGEVFLFLGSATGLGDTPAWSVQEDGVSRSASGAGDVNGDGFDDVIVGLAYDETPEADGAALLYLGSASGLESAPVWAVTDVELPREPILRPVASWTVSSAGDVNGDGFLDVAIGMEPFVNVFYGSAAGLDTVPSWTAEGTNLGSVFGRDVAAAGDVNGDGFDDLVAGDPNWSCAEVTDTYWAVPCTGQVSLFLGGVGGLEPVASWTVESGTLATFGSAVAGAGDVNGDGYGDVLVGEYINDFTAQPMGVATLYLGGVDGLSADPAWTSPLNYGLFGKQVSSAADTNGDGFDDILIGQEHWWPRQGIDKGAHFGQVWLFEGAEL